MNLHLMSHALCPYVQRIAISLSEKQVPFQRTDIDLNNKPDWFVALSPLGKTPVLTVNDQPIFESWVILEYLEETQPNPLHPTDALARAQDRAWMEFGSVVLNNIAGFYSAADEAAFDAETAKLRAKFERLEAVLGEGLFFSGSRFGLVDAVFGPVFRYFDVFDQIADFAILRGLTDIERWRQALAGRPSIGSAVREDYPDALRAFLEKKESWLAQLMKHDSLAAASSNQINATT